MRFNYAAIIAVVALGATSAPAQAAVNFPAGAQTAEVRLKTYAGPLTRAFVVREAARENTLVVTAVSTTFAHANGEAQALGGPSSADVDAVVFLILMQAARDADDDLRAQMADLEKINAQKRAQRGDVAAMNRDEARVKAKAAADLAAMLARGPVGPQVTIDQFLAKSSFRYDAQGDQSEVVQIRLQMAADRRAKFVEEISNLLKKVDSTQDKIVRHMK